MAAMMPDRSAIAAVQSELAGLDWAMHEMDGPFLSIIMRTQGHRTQSMLDALLCLACQSDLDFEILLMVHNPPSVDTVAEIATLIQQEVPQLESRVRIVASMGGTPSRPLNDALPLLRGAYVVLHDDDDLVFGNFVEDFRRASELAPGRVLRSVVADQYCTLEQWDDGTSGFVASGPLRFDYPVQFSLLEHLIGGSTPIHAFAFPRRTFVGLQHSFDEAIAVHEDWDLQVRAIQFQGVHSFDAVTGIYRRHHDSDSLAAFPSARRDVIFDEMVRQRVDGRIFLIEGEELLRQRTKAKVADDLWHQKEEVYRNLEVVFEEKECEIRDREILQTQLDELNTLPVAYQKFKELLLQRIREKTGRA